MKAIRSEEIFLRMIMRNKQHGPAKLSLSMTSGSYGTIMRGVRRAGRCCIQIREHEGHAHTERSRAEQSDESR
jgi:hypothetical protein